MAQLINRKMAAWALVLVALLGGLAAECSGEGGMYQGGGDSSPYYR